MLDLPVAWEVQISNFGLQESPGWSSLPSQGRKTATGAGKGGDSGWGLAAFPWCSTPTPELLTSDPCRVLTGSEHPQSHTGRATLQAVEHKYPLWTQMKCSLSPHSQQLTPGLCFCPVSSSSPTTTTTGAFSYGIHSLGFLLLL